MADSRLHDQSDPAAAAEHEPAPDTPPTPQQMVYRRAPKITPFLVTGGLFGVVIAFFWVAVQGAAEEYSQGQTLGFIAAIFATIGVTLAALWWLLLDRRSKRHAETVYARRTENPQAADVAVTEDDYHEWSQFQQQQQIEDARRQQLAEAKAAAKAKKPSKRK